MISKFIQKGFAGVIVSAFVSHIWLQILCHGQNITDNTSTNSEIDYETLSLFGFTHELADQFRINLIKAIEAEAAKDASEKVDPLRQGEFGGGIGNNQDEEEEEEEQGPTTQGPGAFGVLSGLFGIFSGLAGLNPSRIVQSTVNFFPPGQRMQVQMVVDSLIGFTPPENRTLPPRLRTRRPLTSTPMPISEMMMKEVTEATPTNTTEVVQKGGETVNGTMSSNSSSVDLALSEVVDAAPEPTTTPQGFINVHKILNKSTTPSPPQDEDDENDFEKKEKAITTTEKPKYNSSMTVYKIKLRVSEKQVVTGGTVDEEVRESNVTLSNTTMTFTTPLSV